MGKIENFEITFFKSHPIFIGGESLTGRISIKTSGRVKINSIFMSINGGGEVKWLIIDYYLFAIFNINPTINRCHNKNENRLKIE